MIQSIVRIEVYKKKTSGNSITYDEDNPHYIIDDFVNLSCTKGIETRKDTISFQIINHRELVNGEYVFSKGTNFDIGVKDLIKVYAYNAPMTGVLEDHLILNTYVKSWTYNSAEKNGVYAFKCYNRTEVLLNSFMFAPYKDATRTVAYMIVDSIIKIRNNNVNDIIYAYTDYTGETNPGIKGAYDTDGNLVSGHTGYIQAYKKAAYKTDGSGELLPAYASSVPEDLKLLKVPFTEVYKPFMDHLEDLSTPKYTDDLEAGVYVFWVDNGNNLHWTSKSFVNVKTLNEYEDTTINISKDVDEVVNAVIVNCGTDPNQNGILSLAFNASSMGLNGARWKYIGKTDIGEKIKEEEIKSTEEDGDNYGKELDKDNYPSAYPWIIQTTGSDIYGNWEYISRVTEVDDDDEYKDYFRRVADIQGTKKGDDIVKYAGDPLISGKWQREGNLNIEPNEIVTVNIPSISLVKDLRVVNISHTFQTDWVTTLDLKEDIDYNLSLGV